MGLLLGSVLLDGFEICEAIHFGGAQALAVHKLPGGTRVIDTMGPDDGRISWRGILSGSDASDRARELNAMRVSGIAVPLAWDVFTATVIVSELAISFCNSWWIPYQIGCTVLVGTQMPGLAAVVSNVLSAVVADLGLAGLVPGVSAALALVGAPDATAAGSQAFAAAANALNAAGSAISASIGTAEAGMGSADIVDVVSSAAALARLTSAAGYVGRARSNFVDGWN